MRMLAAISRRGRQSPVLEETELGSPRNGEILVRLVACGICRTDLDAHAGIVRTPRPIVLGHEGAGIVEEVGADVKALSPGDHVVLVGSACGVCRNCKRDLPTYCESAVRRNFGGLRADGTTYLQSGGARLFGHFFGQSSFAQYTIVEESSAVQVPRDLPLQVLAPLGCGVTTGAGAVFNAFAASPEDTIAVFGVGAVGLAATMAARIIGLKCVIAIDRLGERLQLAKELGATHVIDATNADIAESLRACCPNGADFTLNTTSSAEMLTQAVECLAMRGVAGFVAAPHEPWCMPAQTMLNGGRTLRAILGSDASPHYFIPRLIEYHRSGRFPIDRLIAFYPFTSIEEAFSDFAAGRVIKPVLRF